MTILEISMVYLLALGATVIVSAAFALIVGIVVTGRRP